MQRDVLESDAMIVCAGGSAGTYKSETLLVDAAQERWKPKFHGILFRESFPELSRALIPRARALYSQMGATYNSQEHSFRWPSGAVIRFAYLSCDDDVHQHQGPRYSWIGIDESTHMTEFRIRYLLSRLASTDPSMRCRMRLATNPGGPGHALHQHLFLGNRCAHCESGGREAGRIYRDATWLSDKLPVGMTTQYIFGKCDPTGPMEWQERVENELLAMTSQQLIKIENEVLEHQLMSMVVGLDCNIFPREKLDAIIAAYVVNGTLESKGMRRVTTPETRESGGMYMSLFERLRRGDGVQPEHVPPAPLFPDVDPSTVSVDLPLPPPGESVDEAAPEPKTKSRIITVEIEE
jgi:hypothetical protein